MSILGDQYDTAIKGFEGFAPRASWDYKQNSVGWGTRARAPNETIDQAEAQRRYDEEIAKAHGIVKSFAPNVDHGTAAALTSLTFNAGDDWTRSGLGNAIKTGDLDRARASFLQYVNAGGQPLDGLRKRRAAEVAWIGSGGQPDQTGQAPMAMRPRGTRWDEALPQEGGELWDEASRTGIMPAPPVQPPSVAGYQARSAPAVAMQPQQQEQPGFLDQIVARAQNPLFQQGLGMFLAASQGKDLNAGLSAGTDRATAMQGVMMKNLAMKREMAQREAMQKLLQNPETMAGVPPALIEIARTTGDASPIIQHLTKGSGTDDIKEYEYAKARGFQGSLQDWMVNKKASNGEYNKNLVYGTNDAGEVVPMQAGSRGDLVASKLPAGVKLQRDPIKMDAGDSWILLDPTTRAPIGQVKKNLAEAEAAKAVGDARGKAQSDLPGVVSNAQNITTYIDGVLNDPNLDSMIGYSGYLPNVTPQAKALQAKINQLSGQGFLIAFQNLKGAGAITEMEGRKATESLSRLQEMVQSGTDYRQALKDFKAEVQRLVDVAKTKAGTGSGAAAPTADWSIKRVD